MQQPGWDLPDPPGVTPVRGFNPLRWVILGLAGILLVFLAFYVPIPILYEYLPGPAPKVDSLITIDGARTYSSEGSFRLTTVTVETQVTFAEWVASGFDPHSAVVTRDQVTGGQSLEQLQEEQEAQMDASNHAATQVALSELGIATPEGDGARVVATLQGRPADGVLKESDVILRIGGDKVDTVCDVGREIAEFDVGDRINLTVRRDGKVKTVSLETVANPQDPASPFIGIAMEEVNYRFKPGLDVDFDPGEIAGPSAGLMFALQIYDQLTPDDLTHGHQVAGTGEIACDGGVGPIGGVEQKVAGAAREGAEIFLAPTLNAKAARAAAGDDIQVVSVSTFSDAVEFLEALE
ncbi:MAG: PDZ domain-containing protein [Actinobacteria bacterium]|nr:PDZ domain-containing protein [Actinomycetota bacterium]